MDIACLYLGEPEHIVHPTLTPRAKRLARAKCGVFDGAVLTSEDLKLNVLISDTVQPSKREVSFSFIGSSDLSAETFKFLCVIKPRKDSLFYTTVRIDSVQGAIDADAHAPTRIYPAFSVSTSVIIPRLTIVTISFTQ